MGAFTLRTLALVLTCGATVPATAAERLCDNGVVTVSAEDDTLFPAMCTASDRALTLFEQCELDPPEPVKVSLSGLLDQTCLGLFHCGEAQIEVLPPDAIEARRSKIGILKALPTDRLFESVIVHEIAHAAMDNTPCPYENCVASSEYFAYSVQMMDLTDAERALVFPENGGDTPLERVKHDEINAMILYMAPDLFIEKVWRHITAKDDVCVQLHGVQDGTVVFDTFHP